LALCVQLIIGVTHSSASSVQAVPNPISVDQAVEIGLARNPQVVAGKAAAEAALATYRSQAAIPPLTLGATHIQGTSTAPTLNGTNNDTFLDFGETVDTSGQKRYAAAAANEQYKAASFQFQETLLSLRQQIRDAYWPPKPKPASPKTASWNRNAFMI
jgi:outer membrane protein TolC